MIVIYFLEFIFHKYRMSKTIGHMYKINSFVNVEWLLWGFYIMLFLRMKPLDICVRIDSFVSRNRYFAEKCRPAETYQLLLSKHYAAPKHFIISINNKFAIFIRYQSSLSKVKVQTISSLYLKWLNLNEKNYG